MFKQKTVAAIHDISGMGKCSLTGAIPVLSAAGISVATMPTAVLSTQTCGISGYTYRDLTEDLGPFMEHWKTLGKSFDAVYSGFLGSETQIDIVSDFLKNFSREGTLYLCDPAMADNGELYSVFDNNFVVRLIPINLKTFVLQNMYFATAQTTILPSSKPSLDLLYDLLSENPELVIRIVGHTDDVGTEQSNQVLSEGRAKSICQEMVKRGIDAKRIHTAGKGELKPLVPNTSDANRQMNRRVEIEIISGAENVNIERLSK